MKYRTAAALLSVITTAAFAAPTSAPTLIPLPQKLEAREGTFKIHATTGISCDARSQATANYLAAQLPQSTGYPIKVAASDKAAAPKGAIRLTTRNANAALGEEGYELDVTPEAITICAPAQAGLFYGVQTLLQLLPPEVFAPKLVPGRVWTVSCVHIEDQPRFKWRGFMLDVSRHFFNKEEVKQLLALMPRYKLNRFHWHLVDDQGWRIEIKKYPRLIEAGAWRKGIGFDLDPKASTAYGPDGRYGGYYTQADIREVVAFAETMHITIVPEIEMPGHATAALTGYPELSCTGGPFNTDLNGGVFNGVFCVGNEQTFAFLQDVLSEVSTLFPGPFIHIGGDEVKKDNWKQCAKCQARMQQEGLKSEHELQSYFVRRIEKIVDARGRRMIGWSEIREGGLAPNAAVMDWIGGAAEAAGAGHDVVMAPTKYCYFDYYQSTNHSTEPRAIGGYVPLEKVYSLNPLPAGLADASQAHILGAQANLWTEYIPSFQHVQYMAFPRLCALAEVTWSPQSSHDWDGFQQRLQTEFRRLDQLQVNYRPPAGRASLTEAK